MQIKRSIGITVVILTALCMRASFDNAWADVRTGAVTATLPGMAPFARSLLDQLQAQRSELAAGYTPRTRHKRDDGWARYTNRLFLETSPYLLQHAHNPVNWYPWGPAAFSAAQKLNRPVLLSVGYATCHWCHVMEEESFEDLEIAAFLNANFIAVKVDREERPDIDAVYMQAVQAMTGRGGWPMNVWLTPDAQPFYGGTYFPPRDGDRGISVGFLTLLQRIHSAYAEQPEQVLEIGRQLTGMLKSHMIPAAGQQLPDAEMLHHAAKQVKGLYDTKNGGVKGALKFPSSLPIRFLLRYHRRSGDTDYLEMAIHTLRQMAAGGIYDHVGGGFHRYATDSRWQVPHFEKMLYDNAQLVPAYLEAYQVTGDTGFKSMVADILDYVEREMTAPEGGFYSATDADSLTPSGHREEGYFFTWTPRELEKLLGPAQAEALMRHFGVTSTGNFEGRNILHRTGATTAMAPQDLARARKILYQARLTRPAPLKDDKIITAWNGLMISAFARAGAALNRSGYVERATRAATFIWERLLKDDQLYRSYRSGQAKQKGFLEDHAFMVAALLDLYEATQSPLWLRRAMALDKVLEDRFEDHASGGFFRTGTEQETVLAREKPYVDSALPSGNAVAQMNLLRLSELTFDDRFRKRAEKSLKAFTPQVRSSPNAVSHMLMAIDFYLDQPKEIVIVTRPGKKSDAAPFLSALDQAFVPNRILTVAEEGREIKAHARLIPVARGKIALQGQASAYVCIKGVCELPTTAADQFEKQIKQVHPLKPEETKEPAS